MFMKYRGMQLQKGHSQVNIGMQILKERIIVLPAAIYFSVLKLNLRALVAGRAFLNRKIKIVLSSDRILHWEWRGPRLSAEDVVDI